MESASGGGGSGDHAKQDHHTHKARKAGRGAKERKKDQQQKKQGTRVERHNVRASSVANIGRTKRNVQRNLDRSQKKEYVPLDDRRTHVQHETPPPVVVVMGPTGVGKSTLIRSLVKIYTNHNLTSVTGPINVVTGKQKRITLYECPNDTAAMLDCAKIADLVLLVVDAKFGFEMETMEFLNILQTHGFPKVVGIFTHLDQFGKAYKNVKRTKKLLKHRFWTEIYDGAKMFYFSGVIHNKYLKNEIKQLTLFISRVKVRLVCDRTSVQESLGAGELLGETMWKKHCRVQCQTQKRVVMYQKQILVTSSEQIRDPRTTVWPQPLVDLNAFLKCGGECRVCTLRATIWIPDALLILTLYLRKTVSTVGMAQYTSLHSSGPPRGCNGSECRRARP
jgi:GTP-binding protein EngB required for normal cell division